MKEIFEILNHPYHITPKISFTIKSVLIVILVLIATKIVLKLIQRIITRKLEEDEKAKFKSVFSFSQYLVYFIVFIIALHTSGVNVTAVLTASAALLIGVGLALQTLFQDIFSGIAILIDKSVHVGDIIQIDGKVGRVIEIRLRTTRAVTIDNKVLVIPNHLYLTNSLYNWTQNGTTTRESVNVGVAYGSDVELVKKVLLQAANEHETVLKNPEPLVLFTDFGESALQFKLIFTLNDSFKAVMPQSDIRFTIDKLFRDNNIKIPFPQRDVHIVEKERLKQQDLE